MTTHDASSLCWGLERDQAELAPGNFTGWFKSKPGAARGESSSPGAGFVLKGFQLGFGCGL